MSLTVKQCLEANGVLEWFIKSDKDNKYILSGATRIKVAGQLRKTRPEAEEYQKEHMELVKRLGSQVEGTEQIRVKDENMEAFIKENQDMLDAETDVVLSPIDAWALSGVSKKEFEDPDSDQSKQNQIPIDLYTTLINVGVINE